ncbi:hypothetical protein D3C80_1431080 [compost metagenome]
MAAGIHPAHSAACLYSAGILLYAFQQDSGRGSHPYDAANFEAGGTEFNLQTGAYPRQQQLCFYESDPV